MTIANRLITCLVLPVLLLAAPLASAQTVVYYHTDALGSVVAVTDASRTVIEENEYEPYGKVVNHALQDGPGYTGHVADAQTGLIYMQQRYYDDDLGEFPTVDPVSATSVGGNFNRYWYANNNPYKFVDPDGRRPMGAGLSSEEMANGQDFTMAVQTTGGLSRPGVKGIIPGRNDPGWFANAVKALFQKMYQRIPGSYSIVQNGIGKGFYFLIHYQARTWKAEVGNGNKRFDLYMDPSSTVKYMSGGTSYFNPTYLNLYHEVGHFDRMVARDGHRLNRSMVINEESAVTGMERGESIRIGQPGRGSHSDGEIVSDPNFNPDDY